MFELRDPVSSASHLATAIWAVFATLLMLRLTAPGAGRRGAVLVYGLSMVVLFLASGTFHGLSYSRLFQKIDQSAVYILIAGTNTPLLTILLRGLWRRWFLVLVWAFALTGVASLWLLPRPPHPLVVGLYLGLGYLGTIPIFHYYRAVGWRAMNWLWLGAAFYTLGAVCELTQWPVIVPGWVQAHEVLHLCDSAASLMFFLFIIRYVIPFSSEHPQHDSKNADKQTPELATAAPEERRSHFGVRDGVVQR
ncbi:MAG TPA: hemolysin III family protein [Gemmata sp.]|nr:hemolysin III family protein [Gemmata sp.]